MTPVPGTLEPFYKGWDNFNRLLVDAVSPLSNEQLKLSAAPNLRSIGDLAAHIAGSRAGIFHYQLGEGGQEIALFRAIEDRGRRDTTEIVAALTKTWELISDCLERWTPEMLHDEFKDVYDFGGEPVLSRQWIIWHVLEHDLLHGGELFLMLGVHGLTVPEIQRLARLWPYPTPSAVLFCFSTC